MRKINSTRTAIVLTLALGLTGCGGEDSPISRVFDQIGRIPDSVSQSVDNFIQYLKDLQPNEDREPLDASGVTPPTSETDEPVDL